MLEIIKKKRDGGELNEEEIQKFVNGAKDGSQPSYQLAALLMAIFFKGMKFRETGLLTKAMALSGKILTWQGLDGPCVDKHSTGGVGDKTSLILAPLVACCGVYVPMISGRGLGHTGGTLDKLESIPGFQVHFDLDSFQKILRSNGLAMIGQTGEIAPADKTLYALRDVTGTVESIPLITASILSKKIAEGLNALVLDVKTGQGAFMQEREKSTRLAKSLVQTAKNAGLPAQALITNMEHPLGFQVGNAAEVIESIETLKGNGPLDLTTLSLHLAGQMIHAAGKTVSTEEGIALVKKKLDSGAGLEKFRQMVAAQGGNPSVVDNYKELELAPGRTFFNAPEEGVVHMMDAGLIGRAACALGAGRSKVEDSVDPGVGCTLLHKPGNKVKKGEPLIEILHRDGKGLQLAMDLLSIAVWVEDEPFESEPLILEEIL